MLNSFSSKKFTLVNVRCPGNKWSDHNVHLRYGVFPRQVEDLIVILKSNIEDGAVPPPLALVREPL